MEGPTLWVKHFALPVTMGRYNTVQSVVSFTITIITIKNYISLALT